MPYPIRALRSPRVARALCLVFGLGGCAAHTSIDVTRRTSLSPAVKGAPFLVLLNEDEGSDPAYQGYAAALATQLQAQGLAAVNDPKKARYAVMLERDWPHAHRASDESDGGTDGSGMGGRGFGGGGGHHHGGGGGDLGKSRSDTHDTTLRIAVFDLSKPNAPQEQVFFASAHAPVGQDENDAAVDTMIQAALQDFPGKRRETFSVALPAKQANLR